MQCVSILVQSEARRRCKMEDEELYHDIVAAARDRCVELAQQHCAGLMLDAVQTWIRAMDADEVEERAQEWGVWDECAAEVRDAWDPCAEPDWRWM